MPPKAAPKRASKKAAPARKASSSKSPARKATAKKAGAKSAAKPARKSSGPLPPVMTLKHLAEMMANSFEVPKRQAVEMLTGFVENVTTCLKKGSKLRIGGLGILQVRHRPARMGRNPATGEAIKIKASKKIAFRPSKELKTAV